jgi:hypothetical protein
MVQSPLLPRRQLLRFAALGGAVAGSGLLAGCRGSSDDPLLLSARGELPPAWVKALPKPWRLQPLDSPAAVLEAAMQGRGAPAATLLQLSDGWAAQLDPAVLQPLVASQLLAQLAPMAAPVSRLFQPEGSPALAFPWAFGTWVLVLRNRPDLVRRGAEGWDLLLDPSLCRKLVLPSSPRVVMELATRLTLRTDPLRQLRQQALAFDERDGLNLLLAGDADGVVVPSHRAVPLLISDPRLQALLPASGSPLWWNLLLRPAAASKPLPLEWLRDGLTLPLLDRLLAGGWVPPLPREQLAPALKRWPPQLRGLLLPPPAVLARCTNLEPLTAMERQRRQDLWDRAAPESL